VAVTFATGMAAVTGALGVLKAAGDQIVAHQILYGCTQLAGELAAALKICTNC
jgi:O-acetylhomoserine/O-acetylserine sulfhydrylase-like pyridoxal-dependent enzyme